MLVFCHLLNDSSGSPRALTSTVEALRGTEAKDLLYIGSQGRGVLEATEIPKRRYWYQRSRFRPLTLVTFFASQLLLYRALSKAADISDDAVIFVNTLLPFGAALWGRHTGRHVVIHVHELSINPAPLRWFLTACAAKCASQLIYVSRDHLKRLPINGPPAEIIPNAVSSAIAEHATPYSPRRSGMFNVLMLASLRGYKGINEFISLAQGLADREDISFTLVLNAEQLEVDAFVREQGEVRNVRVCPRTNDPALFYESADLVLNLSRVDQWIETFGLTVAEAMTFGIPVIAPPVGGPSELVNHGREGFLIDSRDQETLRATVLYLASNPARAMEMSGCARARAQSFTFTEYAQRLKAVLAPFCPERRPK